MPVRQIALLIFADCSMLDFTGPLSAFDAAKRVSQRTLYKLTLLSEAGGLVRSSAGACTQTEPIGRAVFDTLIVAGGGAPREGLVSDALRRYIQRMEQAARRIAGVCTGAFVLAAAGILDGRHATTHWRMAAKLQKMHPKVLVESDRIYSRDGAVWTSAGIDLALALIEDDHGAELARAVAREHLQQELTVDILAEVACLSRRQFDRAFAAETGQTPARAIEQMRAEAARLKSEGSSASLDAIARASGFGSPERMRRACMRRFGQPPASLRRLARQAAGETLI